jgi:hypothetical protein
MSEKLYALLLRLYPAQFRRNWEEDALQLFRDRLQDERGTFRRLRLWFDLLADLAVSAPREHRRAPRTVPVPVEARLFQVLEMEAPGPTTFFFGGALALAGVAAFVILLSYAGERKPYRGQSSAGSQLAAEQAAAPGSSQLSAADQAQFPKSGSDAAHVPAQSPEAVFLVDAAERRRVIAAVIENLRHYEQDRAAARRMTAALLSSQRNRRYDSMTDGRTFADALNQQMARVSPGRAVVFYTNIPFTKITPSSTTHRIDDTLPSASPCARSWGVHRRAPKGQEV